MATPQEHTDFIKLAYLAVEDAMTEARAASDAYIAAVKAAALEGVRATPENGPLQLMLRNEEPLEIFTRADLFKAPRRIEAIEAIE